MTHPTEHLTAAARRLRNSPITTHDRPLADLLDTYAERFAIWRGPHISTELGHALTVARAVLGLPDFEVYQ